MPDITGQVLRDRYQIERLLGRGGMADVYLAFDTQRQTHVALKLIREDLADDTDFIRRFSREAAALARLDHPNVVRFYSTEQDGQLSFIVMDYVPGSTLQRRIAQAAGPLPMTEVTALLHQIGSALHYAHSLGFIHRDIKPGNIMLREDGTALLSDFGAARVAENATLASLTIGTPAYMSPEQILGKELEAPSDIYSFGLVLYETLTGRRPFSGDEAGLTGTGTISRLREAHLRLEPPNPTDLNPQIPQALSAVLLKSLAKDVDDRWPNVVALMDAWDAALGGSRQAGSQGRRSDGRRRLVHGRHDGPHGVVCGSDGRVAVAVPYRLAAGLHARRDTGLAARRGAPACPRAVRTAAHVDCGGSRRRAARVGARGVATRHARARLVAHRLPDQPERGCRSRHPAGAFRGDHRGQPDGVG